ncbi:hypothetical protein Tco_0051971 [Tanacetum coccineum]
MSRDCKSKIHGEDKTVGSLVEAGLQRDFARRYSDKKCKFKDKWFNKKTVEQARQEKPPKWKAGDAQWQKRVDFWSDPDRMKQSERNAANRAKNKAELKAIQDAITAGTTFRPKTDRQIFG